MPILHVAPAVDEGAATRAQAQGPMQFTYMRMTRFMLQCLVSWPHEALGDPQRWHLYRNHKTLGFQAFIIVVLQILYLKQNTGVLDFYQLGHTYITLLMTVVNMQRLAGLSPTRGFHEVTRAFVCEMHLYHYQHKSPYAMQVHREVHRLCELLCGVMHVQMVVGPLLFNLTPVLSNYRAGLFGDHPPPNATYQLSTYYVLPFDCTTDFKRYVAVSIVNTYCTSFTSASFMMFDLYMALIVFHTWGHLKILDHNLRNFPLPEATDPASSAQDSASLLYSPEDSRRISELLKENIDYHRLLMNFAHKNSSAFGFTLFVYYAFHQICGCILLFECSSLDSAAIGKYGALTLLSFQQLIQISIIFELIATRGEALVDAVYAVPWEHMRTPERRTLLIFLINVQASPLSFKALGLVPVGVRTMGQILRTSISYFLMLRTMTE